MLRTLLIVVTSAIVAVACSSSSSSSSPQTGNSCSAPAQCYPGIDAGALKGTVQCLTNLQNGYCTHTCTQDSDCCAVPGECNTGLKEVCAPQSSNPQTYCFVSCASADIPAGADANAFCQQHANPTFTCRSTGGGSANRKFCGP